MLVQIIEKASSVNGIFDITVNVGNQEHIDCQLKNPLSNEEEDQLEWYFEQYGNEPYTANARVEKVIQIIENYGNDLYKQIFSHFNHSLMEKITAIEIIGASSAFQSLHWETLKAPTKKPIALRDVTFSRKSKIEEKQDIDCLTPAISSINILIVTARPNEESDVNYFTIQRPLVEVVQNVDLPVILHILRPGTLESFIKHLQKVGRGFYHIVHFDVHGALMEYQQEFPHDNRPNLCLFLEKLEDSEISEEEFDFLDEYINIEKYSGKMAFIYFESSQKGIKIPLSSSELANILKKYEIPICIFNACQSAKQDDITNETNLAKALHEAGVQTVLGMRYSVNVMTATLFMETIYQALLAGNTFSTSIAAGRKAIFEHKNRLAKFGYTIQLDDWVIPIVYQKQEVQFQLSSENEEKAMDSFVQRTSRNFTQMLSYGFHGRDLDIIKIEKQLLLQHNHLLLGGLWGVGKTTLLKYLTEWWMKTNFICEDFYFSYDMQSWTLEQILLHIADRTLPENERTAYLSQPFDIQKKLILEKLNSERYCLILDQLEIIENESSAKANVPNKEKQTLQDFLSKIKHSFVIYGSRSTSEWLQVHTFQNNIFFLEGFNKTTSYKFANSIIEKFNLDFSKLILEEELSFLLDLLSGNPLALKVILPHMKDKTLSQIIKDFQEGSLTIYSQTEKKTEDLFDDFENVWNNLSDDTRKCLILLFPFQVYAPITEIEIHYYFKCLRDENIEVKDFSFKDVVKTVDEVAQFGLLRKIYVEINDTPCPFSTHLSPLLSLFIRKKVKNIEGKNFITKLEKGFLVYYNVWLVMRQSKNLYSKSNKLWQDIALQEIKFGYYNILTTIQMLLNHKKSFEGLLNILGHYFVFTQQFNLQIFVSKWFYKKVIHYKKHFIDIPQLFQGYCEIIVQLSSALIEKQRYKEAEEICNDFLAVNNSLSNNEVCISENQLAYIYQNLAVASRHNLTNINVPNSKLYLEKRLAVLKKIEEQKDALGTYTITKDGKIEPDNPFLVNLAQEYVNLLGLYLELPPLDNFDIVLKYSAEAIDILETLNDNRLLGMYHQNLGTFFIRMFEACKTSSDPSTKFRRDLVLQRYLSGAEKNLNEARKFFKLCNDVLSNAMVTEDMAILAFHKEESLDRVTSLFKKALSVYMSDGTSLQQAKVFYHLGLLCENIPYEERIEYLRKALSGYCEFHNESKIIKALRVLIKLNAISESDINMATISLNKTPKEVLGLISTFPVRE